MDVTELQHEDGVRETPSGATFTVPKGWLFAAHGEIARLTSPEKDVWLAAVEIRAADAHSAVREAWRLASPSFNRTLKMAQAMPAREGWSEAVNFGYDVSPDEKVMISAIALRAAAIWTVLLFHGSEAGFERRKAQVRLFAAGVRPAKYKRESFKGRAAHLGPREVELLKTFVQDALDVGGIPGAALTLVRTDEVLFEGGFGFRALGESLSVDADTLFMIASNTKQFTTLLLAKLIDEGRFTWDTPVKDVFPNFALGDPAVAEQMQMRHLVSASTGLPRKDIEWLLNFGDSTAQTVFDLLRNMRPTSKFGEVFQYSNVLGSAAGYVAGHALHPDLELGAAFDRAMQTRVFNPLGLTASTFDYQRALSGNHASPHAEDIEAKPARVQMAVNFAAHPMRPSLGLWTNVRDLGRYVQMELARGAGYIGATALLERRKPGVVFEEGGAYGMGLVLRERAGITVVDHGGALMGYKSNIFWLPDYGLGGAILTNADNGNLLVQGFVRKLLEVIFDGRAEADEDLRISAEHRREQILKHRDELQVPAPNEKLADLYSNEILGQIRVIRGDATIFDFGEWQSEVALRANADGTLSYFTIDPGVSTFEFVTRDGGLLIRDKQHEYFFKREPLP